MRTGYDLEFESVKFLRLSKNWTEGFLFAQLFIYSGFEVLLSGLKSCEQFFSRSFLVMWVYKGMGHGYSDNPDDTDYHTGKKTNSHQSIVQHMPTPKS